MSTAGGLPVTLTGGCHCGAVRVTFRTRFDLDRLHAGRCDCSFCRSHGARTGSDREGQLEIAETRPGTLRRYRFGLRTADFLLCATCGVYVAAFIASPGDEGAGAATAGHATLNLNLLDRRTELPDAPPLVNYDAETAEARRARRRAQWTPTTILPA